MFSRKSEVGSHNIEGLRGFMELNVPITVEEGFIYIYIISPITFHVDIIIHYKYKSHKVKYYNYYVIINYNVLMFRLIIFIGKDNPLHNKYIYDTMLRFENSDNPPNPNL